MSNSNKQTSIVWFEKNLLKYGYVNKAYYNTDSLNHLENLIEQAKEMHKQEIEDAYSKGVDDEYEYHINSEPRKNSEIYYNETFGGNNE